MTQIADCAAVREEYSSYREGSLAPERMAAIDTHLGSCQMCRTVFDQLDQLLLQMHSLPTLKASSDFNDRLLERIHGSRDALWSKVFRNNSFRVSSYAAAAGLAVALLFTQWMEPVQQAGGSTPQITSTQGSQPQAVAEILDSSQIPQDSLDLVEPAVPIDQQLQLVKGTR